MGEAVEKQMSCTGGLWGSLYFHDLFDFLEHPYLFSARSLQLYQLQ